MIIWLLPENSAFDFLKSIGDAIIVLIMCLIFFTLPLKIIKESFIELGGGIMQDTATKALAEKGISTTLYENRVAKIQKDIDEQFKKYKLKQERREKKTDFIIISSLEE